MSQIDDDFIEFSGCVEARARAQASAEGLLGVYTRGWYYAWIHDAYSVEGGDAAVLALLGKLQALQEQLHVDDAALCPLIEAPCALVLEARRESVARQRGAR